MMREKEGDSENGREGMERKSARPYFYKMAQRQDDVVFSPGFLNCWPPGPRAPEPPAPPSIFRSIFNLMSLANVRKASSTLIDALKEENRVGE